jgi:hypothetical protein
VGGPPAERQLVRWVVGCSASVATALLLGGCAFSTGPEPLQALARSADDTTLADDTWPAVSSHAEEVGAHGRFFLLPAFVTGDLASVSPGGDDVTRTGFTAVNPGLAVIPLLPLWWTSESRLIRRSGERATSSMTWTPLYASSTATDWPADIPTLSASGVPLLYSRVTYGTTGARPSIDVHAWLWTLGPSWMSLDLDLDSERATGWWFMPLTLGCFGDLLWLSSEQVTDTTREVIHGPIHGWLGYRSDVDTSARTSSRSLLAGLLWYDSADSDVEGDMTREIHGPLWGMFGWGRSEGRATIRVFWYPIELE